MNVKAQRCGFIAIVGAPNVGKSTLLNRIVGSKVSIVSPKVQTTRTRVLGIAQHDRAQLIFIDTPGIFTPRRRLDRAMVAAAWTGAEDADTTLMVIDAKRGIDRDSERIIARFKADGRRVVLVLNKIDLVKKADLLAQISRLDEEGIFSETFLVSAETGDGVGDLLDALAARVPEGPWHYPEDQLSDMNDRLLAAEITREKLYLQLHQELPYAATVETEEWEERPDGSVAIRQVIFVERDSQKGIILGKGGARIKQIGAASRLELEEILERRVHVFLFVKVREKWGDDPDRYRDWGLDYDA
ncbi:GTPase Era [Varunaivibrio sulfuroxidans]|uniref:GTPase Era n=1 Tax=Varunaivibrio sulfuroxidans TaxID=1773489 RepID=A0A4R3JHG9_9PROT|nr:GTPase Era [Varunaivibrio sulfuroxidans]TCS64230.1 GTP-binding protein Era [Varunaivibrio sulfuroxidans]WES31329.1 GTPase Era [Varunaivibrio sulfuroxidans]